MRDARGRFQPRHIPVGTAAHCNANVSPLPPPFRSPNSEPRSFQLEKIHSGHYLKREEADWLAAAMLHETAVRAKPVPATSSPTQTGGPSTHGAPAPAPASRGELH